MTDTSAVQAPAPSGRRKLIAGLATQGLLTAVSVLAIALVPDTTAITIGVYAGASTANLGLIVGGNVLEHKAQSTGLQGVLQGVLAKVTGAAPCPPEEPAPAPDPAAPPAA